MKKLLFGLCTYLILTSAALAAVNLNTATMEELDAVNGIGPVKAQAILDHREKNGPFKSVDDLQNVKGFGNKSVNKLRSKLTVGSSKSKVKTSTKAAH
ncbi:MAG: ComEA family DNA-binding protein [Candidatus Nitrotoga sp.]